MSEPQVNDTSDPTIPEVATVTVKQAVDGTKKRKVRSDKGKKRRGSVTEPLHTHVKVDERVMLAAKQAMKPGQRLVIVDAECVRLVNA